MFMVKVHGCSPVVSSFLVMAILLLDSTSMCCILTVDDNLHFVFKGCSFDGVSVWPCVGLCHVVEISCISR